MRKSRLVLVGVAVAAAAAVGSAFTAGNSFGTTKDIAGYGESTVTGATVTNIHYTVDSNDSSKLDSVEFTTVVLSTKMSTPRTCWSTGPATYGSSALVRSAPARWPRVRRRTTHAMPRS